MLVIVVLLAGSLVVGTGTSARAADAARIELLAPGDAPRSPLRMAVPEGATALATMQMSQSIKQTMAGREINSVTTPPIEVRMHASAGAPAASGNVPVSYSYSDAGIVDDGSLTAEQRAQYDAAFAPLNSLAGTGTLTPRNQFVDSEITGLDQQDVSTAQLLTQLSDQFDTMTVGFPREAVGVGAQWKLTSNLTLNGIKVRQTTKYTLQQREGDRVVLDVELVQTAPPQRTSIAGLPQGAKVEIVKWKASGSGTTTLSLVQPVLPVESTMRMDGNQRLAVTVDGDRAILRQEIAGDVTVTP